MKSWSKIALIPAYNPEYCLVDLVQTLKKKGFWILVVDDGSSEEHKIIFRDINDVGKCAYTYAYKKMKGKEVL